MLFRTLALFAIVASVTAQTDAPVTPIPTEPPTAAPTTSAPTKAPITKAPKATKAPKTTKAPITKAPTKPPKTKAPTLTGNMLKNDKDKQTRTDILKTNIFDLISLARMRNEVGIVGCDVIGRSNLRRMRPTAVRSTWCKFIRQRSL